MNKMLNDKMRTLIIAYSLFLVLLLISSIIGGVWSRVIYFIAFILPIVITSLIFRKDILPQKSHIAFNYEKIKLTLPTLLPAVALVALSSLLTSLLIQIISGKAQTVELGNSLPLAILNHALLPAVLEEILFRYLPIRLLAPHSKRAAILLSAAAFALVHHSFYSIPYAFIAGLIFMTLDIALDSIYPSLIIHFLNNLLSIIIVFGMPIPLAVSLLCLLGLSVGAIVKNKKTYGDLLKGAFEKGENYSLGMEFTLFATFSIVIAVFTF